MFPTVLLSHSNWMNLQTSETAQLLVSIRMTFEDFNVKEELLGTIYFIGRATHKEMFHYLYSFVTKSNVPLHKLVSITTDGAKSMTGQVNGFIALCIHFCRIHFLPLRHSPASFWQAGDSIRLSWT
jgi:hypothetical protein